MIQKWKRLGEGEVLAKGYGKELRSVPFLNPETGREEEFILYGQPDWVVILPLTNDGMVVTIRQYYQGADKIVHTLPGGNLKPNENPEETVIRELSEETGYQSKEIILLGCPLWPSTRNSTARYFAFLGIGSKKMEEIKKDTEENVEVKLIPLEKWVKMAEKEIEDHCAVVATFRALSYLRTKKLHRYSKKSNIT